MSWAEIKKAINSNLDVPLDKLIDFAPSTPEVRSALTALGYTQRSTITSPMGTIYLFWKNASVKSCSWDEAYEICTNWWKEINRWSVEQGYGNICIASRMPAYFDTGSWLPSGNTWTGTQASSDNNHFFWYGSNYNNTHTDNTSYQVVPVAFII